MEYISEKWPDVMNYMKNMFNISELAYDTWFRPIKIDGVDNDKIYIEVQDKVCKSYIEKKYIHLIETSIFEVTGESYEVIVTTADKKCDEIEHKYSVPCMIYLPGDLVKLTRSLSVDISSVAQNAIKEIIATRIKMYNFIIEKWPEVIKYMGEKFDIADIDYETWIKPLTVDRVDDNVIYIKTKDKLIRRYTEKRYGVMLQKAVDEVMNKDLIIKIA